MNMRSLSRVRGLEVGECLNESEVLYKLEVLSGFICFWLSRRVDGLSSWIADCRYLWLKSFLSGLKFILHSCIVSVDCFLIANCNLWCHVNKLGQGRDKSGQAPDVFTKSWRFIFIIIKTNSRTQICFKESTYKNLWLESLCLFKKSGAVVKIQFCKTYLAFPDLLHLFLLALTILTLLPEGDEHENTRREEPQ